MTEDYSPEESAARERLLFWSVIVTFCSLLPTAYGALISNSTALFTDLLRCCGEFVAILVSWLVLRQLLRNDSKTYNYGLGKLEQLASLAVAAALFVSFVIAFGVGIQRILSPQPLESTRFGFVFAVLGTLGNAFLWAKDYQYSRTNPSPVMEAQWRLFRAKTIATSVLVVTLGASWLFRAYAFAPYLDPFGSLLLSLFLLYSSYTMVSASIGDLIDRSVDEKVELIILNALQYHKNRYEQLERVRTRRSGSRMFIDIFLSFDADTQFRDVHECVMAIKYDLKQRLGKAEVIVIPSIR